MGANENETKMSGMGFGKREGWVLGMKMRAEEPTPHSTTTGNVVQQQQQQYLPSTRVHEQICWMWVMLLL